MRSVNLTINGRQRRVVTTADKVLLDLLRDDLGLTGTKQSCDKKGQCGACMVIINGRAVRSCLTKVASLEGADIITVEGLGTPENPHLIQEAFVLSGAIQCGFCTPGMIMSAKALLDKDPDPDEEAIKKALRHNICRCTGYTKIIDAIKLAGRFLRGEITPDQVRPDPDGPKVGVSHPRPSALAKACGTAEFTADIKVPGALALAVVRSPYAHADIKGVDSSLAEKMPGVAGVMTAKDIKGTNRLKLAIADRPLLCEDKVRSLGEAVAIVAAETPEKARAAAEAVKVDYQVLEVLDSPAKALAEGAPQLHPHSPNLCYSQPQIKGDAEAALAGSAAMVEHRFSTSIIHQSPLEPEACVAWLEEDPEGDEPILTVVGRSINIHAHLAGLQAALGYENMRYLEAYSGGQFGLKLEITSEGIAAAAALHFQSGVRYIPSLAESMLMTSKRHSFNMKVRMGADDQGRITAYTNDFMVDKGAYFSIGQGILVRTLGMLSGSYNIPNIKALGKIVYTNNPYGSAARGAGPPQGNFALECTVEMMARKLGQDSLDFRLKNSLLPGQTKSTGRAAEQWPIPELIEKIRPHYDRAVAEAAAHKEGPVRRGVGLGCGSFGISLAGDAAVAAVELDPDNGVSVYAAAADPGEGNDAMFTQLAAHMLDLPLDKVRIHLRDTDNTTAAGPAAGSRITFMVGGALQDAINQLKEAMEEAGARTYQGLVDAGKPVRYLGRKRTTFAAPPMDPETGQGPGFEVEIHAIQMAEVEVDIETGQASVVKMTAVVDAGTAINPQNIMGQLEGGMDMGAGLALREKYVAGETTDWKTYKFPTMEYYFDKEVLIHETPRINATQGAIGVGEMALVPTAPAIINGIYDAAGVWVTNLPATPDKIKAALAGQG